MSNFINSPAIGSHQTDIWPVGVDRNLSQFDTILGHYEAAVASTWRIGMFLAPDTAGRMVLSDGTNVVGMALSSKTTALLSAVADEVIRFNATNGTATLAHPNVTNVAVRSAALQGGTTYTVTTDYTVNAGNGTVTQVGGGAPIPLNTDIYVTYTWAMTAGQQLANGSNWSGDFDDVTRQGGKVAMAVGKMNIFTLEYDTSRTYTYTGAGANLYVSSTGILTNNTAGGVDFVGRVMQVPRANYPFLGASLNLSPVVI